MATTRKTVRLVQFSMLLAIEAIFCFTVLGSLPIGPLVATLAHLPVIVTAVTLGLGAGAAMGAFTGLFSVIYWTFMPSNPALAFVFTPFYSFGEFHGSFWSIVISVVPRVLIGVVAALVYKAVSGALRKNGKTVAPAYIAAGILGSLANTAGVLGGIYLFFGQSYASALGMPYTALLAAIGSVIATNGLLEAAVAAVVALGVGVPVNKLLNRSQAK